MRQIFLYLIPIDSQLQKLTKRLEAVGFQVAPSQRAVGGVLVRVRTDTGDEGLVERIIAEVAPDTRRGPSGAPTTEVKGYREGR
jgi:hypothetical protein